MKAFTVYQPYAHAIVAGVKHYETRPRRTHIRGRVAVHAGRLDEVQATKHLTNGEFWAVLEAAGGGGNLPGRPGGGGRADARRFYRSGAGDPYRPASADAGQSDPRGQPRGGPF